MSAVTPPGDGAHETDSPEEPTASSEKAAWQFWAQRQSEEMRRKYRKEYITAFDFRLKHLSPLPPMVRIRP